MVPETAAEFCGGFFWTNSSCASSANPFSAGSTPLPISRAHRLDRQGSDSFENWRGLASDIRRLRPVLCFSDNSYILRHQS
jgi:hypothetical protein